MSNELTLPGSLAPVRQGDVLASKYRVEEVLGVGGMGVVVAAEHIELSQKVALKFLLKEAAANDDLVGRFLREARASVRLKGIHVAKTLDVGRLEGGCPYIVMEFLDGHDLHAEIRARDGRLEIEDAASYVVQVAEGLAEAHSLGIVHRDLKPGNLFLTRGLDGRPLVKVLDFGISKTMDSSDGLSLTKTDTLLGSPLYMSPEQMRSSKDVDERSDIWALGAIAFELLTGKVPFDATSLVELLLKVAQDPAPSPKLLRPELPDALCAAVLKCLEKDADTRFLNVGELAQAFEPFALARDRGKGQRALDVLGAGTRAPMRSDPDLSNATESRVPGAGSDAGSDAGPVAGVGSGPDLGAVATPSAIPAPGVPLPAPSPSEPVAPAAWGTTQAHGSRRSRKGIVALGLGVVLVASIGGLVAARRDSGEGPAAAAGSATGTNEGATVSAATDSEAATGALVGTNAFAAPPTTGVLTPLPAESGAAAAASSSPPVPAKPARHAPSPAGATAATAKIVKAAVSSTAKPASTPAAPAPASTGGFIKVRE